MAAQLRVLHSFREKWRQAIYRCWLSSRSGLTALFVLIDGQQQKPRPTKTCPVDFCPVASAYTISVNKNFHVDDCLKSSESESMAIKLVSKLNELLMRGGFPWTKWLCNSPRVLATIPQSERASSVKEFDWEILPTERALGVRWNLESGTFGFKVKFKDKPLTRRGMLSIESSVYDPFGFVSPFVLPAKAVLQDLCRRGLSWDEAMPEESLKCWKEWLFELPHLEEFLLTTALSHMGLGRSPPTSRLQWCVADWLWCSHLHSSCRWRRPGPLCASHGQVKTGPPKVH